MDTFPTDLLPPRGLRYWLAGMGVGGGAALTAPGQFADWSGGGWWCADYDVGRLSRPVSIKLYRAILMRIASGAAEIVVPIVDDPQLPWAAGGPSLDAGVPHDDDTPFSDGSLYGQEDIVFNVVGGGAERATQLVVTRIKGGPLTGGEYFTLLHPEAGPRAYLVEGLRLIGPDVYEIDFGPPLRDACADGDLADFRDPRFVARLIPGSGDAWPSFERPFKTMPSMRFVESFDYLEG